MILAAKEGTIKLFQVIGKGFKVYMIKKGPTTISVPKVGLSNPLKV